MLLRILIIEDSTDDVELMQRELIRGGIEFTLCIVKTRNEFEQALGGFKPDIILSDHSLPAFNSIEAIKILQSYLQKVNLIIPFILVTGSVSEEFAVQCMKIGADDFILKDRLKRLPVLIKAALNKTAMETERIQLMETTISQFLKMDAEHISGFGSWRIDIQTGTHEWSDEAFRIFGFEPGEVTPNYENVVRHVHPADKEKLASFIQQVIADVRIAQCEYRVVDEHHRVKYLNSRAFIRPVGGQQRYELVGFTFDIIRSRLHAKTFEAQNRKLSEIGWIQSHEVRGPLARILGLVQLLTSYQEPEINFKECLNHISQSANELDEIVRKVVRLTERVV